MEIALLNFQFYSTNRKEKNHHHLYSWLCGRTKHYSLVFKLHVLKMPY